MTPRLAELRRLRVLAREHELTPVRPRRGSSPWGRAARDDTGPSTRREPIGASGALWTLRRRDGGAVCGVLRIGGPRGGHTVAIRLAFRVAAARDVASLLPRLLRRADARAPLAVTLETPAIGGRRRVLRWRGLTRTVARALNRRLARRARWSRAPDPARLVAFGIPADYGLRRGLPRVPEATCLRDAGPDRFDRAQWLEPATSRAFERLRAAAARDGVTLQLVSAFRDLRYQAGLIRRKLDAGQSLDTILAVSAAPGYSQHHDGRTVDLASPEGPVLEEAFEHSPAFAWLTTHAARFGFRLSYPRGNPYGIAYEPWHWRYRATLHGPGPS